MKTDVEGGKKPGEPEGKSWARPPTGEHQAGLRTKAEGKWNRKYKTVCGTGGGKEGKAWGEKIRSLEKA